MLDKKCILFIYSEGKYDTVSLAVADNLEKSYKDAYIIKVSDYELLSFKRAQISRKFYIFSCRNAGFLNRLKDGLGMLINPMRINATKKALKAYKRPNGGLGKYFYRISEKYRRIFNTVIRFTPDVIICSAPELLNYVCKAKSNASLNHCNVIALMSDYTVDKRFVNYRVNNYFVQNETVKAALEGYGIESEKIETVGTPLNPLTHTYDKQECLTELGIENGNPNIVLIGGRYGSVTLKDIFTRCIEVTADANIIILTGGSDSLGKYCAYVAKSKECVDKVFIVESIDDISKLYTTADIVIATPTACITYEIMRENKPLILAKGMDKSEKGNAHYLASDLLALRGDNADDALASIDKYLSDNEFTQDIFSKQKDFTSRFGMDTTCNKIMEIAEINFNAKKEIEEKRKLVQIENNSKKE